MTPQRRLSRRALLKAGAGAAVAAIGVAHPHAPSESRLLADRLRGLVSHRAGAAVIGAAYLDRADAERSADTLAAAIVPARLRHRATRISDARLRALVTRALRDDFAAGRTFVLRGWVVSATEARLAALQLLG